MKNRTRRICAVMLAVVLMLSGCGENAGGKDGKVTLRIVTEEIGQSNRDWATPRLINQLSMLIIDYKESHENVDIVWEKIPFSGEARTAKLEQLRTELMAGKGPDVLILPGGSVLIGEMGVFKEGLLPNVELAMRNGLFTDISEYYDADTELGKDSLNTTVMDAGVVDGARYVLPLRYDFPVACVNMDAFAQTGLSTDIFEGGIMTFMEASAQVENETACSMMVDYNMLFQENLLSQAIDYDEQKVIMTKDELANYAEVYLRYFAKCRMIDNNPEHADMRMFGRLDLDTGNEIPWHNSWINSGHWMCVEPLDRTIHAVARAKSIEAELQMFPLRAADGKLTADVTLYGAVGAGCKNPDIAYDFLRQLLLEDFQWEKNTDADTAFVYLAAQGYPVRTKGSVSVLAQGLAEQIGFERTSLDRKQMLLSLTDADMPVLNASVDRVIFPISWYDDVDGGIKGAYLAEKNDKGKPDTDSLAEQWLKNLEWHLAES